MVSPNSSADDASSGSMEEKQKRFYNASRQPPPSSSSSESQSESESESEGGSPRKKKKAQPPPTNVAASPKPSSKRPRNEEQSRGLQKKPKEGKKPAPLEAAKQQSGKKTNEDKKKMKKSDSPPPKSAKKNGQLWYTQDEIRLLKGVLAYQASKGLPKTNLSPVYEYIRKLNHLEHDYTNSQMSDKLRRLKARFVGLKDNDHRFKNPHEETLYKLCRKIWESGEGEEEKESTDGEDGKNAVEEDEKKSKAQGVERVEEEDEAIPSQGNLASNGAQKQSNTKENGKQSVSTETGNYVQFSSEEMIKRNSSTRVWPALDTAEAERLDHKWQKQNLIELDVSSKHLQLLQEECQLRIKKLRSQVEERNP